MVKPKDIPIYGEVTVPSEVSKKEPDVLLSAVKETRLAAQNAYNEALNVISPIKESAVNIVETKQDSCNCADSYCLDEGIPQCLFMFSRNILLEEVIEGRGK